MSIFEHRNSAKQNTPPPHCLTNERRVICNLFQLIFLIDFWPSNCYSFYFLSLTDTPSALEREINRAWISLDLVRSGQDDVYFMCTVKSFRKKETFFPLVFLIYFDRSNKTFVADKKREIKIAGGGISFWHRFFFAGWIAKIISHERWDWDFYHQNKCSIHWNCCVSIKKRSEEFKYQRLHLVEHGTIIL